MSHIQAGFWRILRNFRFLVLGFILPKKGKRILMLVSLHAQLVQDGVFDDETLKKLNESMRLADSEDALNYPAHFHNVVWGRDRLPEEVVSQIGQYSSDQCLPYTEAQRVSKMLVDLTPAWLRYDTYDNMGKDVIRLFACNSLRHV